MTPPSHQITFNRRKSGARVCRSRSERFELMLPEEAKVVILPPSQRGSRNDRMMVIA